MWGNLGNSKYAWTAGSYLATFIVYSSVSMAEMGAWAFQITGVENPCSYEYYVTHVSYYIQLYLGLLPCLLPVFQLVLPSPGGLAGNIQAEFGHNSLLLIVGNVIMYIIGSFLHVTYVPQLTCKKED